MINMNKRTGLRAENSAARTGSQASVDEGLRAHFRRIYNTMTLGLIITGLTAFAVSESEAMMQFLFTGAMKWVVIFAPLAFVFFGFNQAVMEKLSPYALQSLFYVFSAVFGLSLSTIFMVYSGTDIARVFFITAAMFAATSLYGYTTKRDLSALGSFLFMGVIGLLIAMVVNIFLQSTMMHFIISVLGVLIYTGLVAFDTQNQKNLYLSMGPGETAQKLAVMGALSLYIDFIMMFQFLLSLLGGRE